MENKNTNNTTIAKPITYSLYDKEYSYYDLARNADKGLEDYISSLSLNNKQSQAVREAYSNLMNGIKDGSVTFDSGKYVDSKGRYTNHKSENKDYYGLAANYIYKHQIDLPEYISSTKGGITAITTTPSKFNLTQEIVKGLFGRTDNIDYQDFIDLDAEIDGNRAVTNRAKVMAETLSNIYNNYDNLSDEDDSTRSYKKDNLLRAISALKDGKIDSGDFLALSRATGTSEFRKLFFNLSKLIETNNDNNTSTAASPRSAQMPSKTPQTQTPSTLDLNRQKVADMILQKYPIPTSKLDSLDLSVADSMQNLGSAINAALGKVSSDNLLHSVQIALTDPKHTLLLARAIGDNVDSINLNREQELVAYISQLQSRGLLLAFGENGSNLYYIPKTWNKSKNTGWVFDASNNSLNEMSIHDIAPIRNKIIEEVSQDLIQEKATSSPNEYIQSRYFSTYTPSEKNGGILKAQLGSRIIVSPDELAKRVNNPWDFVTYTEDALKPENRVRHNWDGKTLSLEYRGDKIAKDTIAPGNKRYDIEPGGVQVEASPHYLKYLQHMLSNPRLAEAWAREYRKSLQTLYPHVYTKWFDSDDKFNFKGFQSWQLPDKNFIFNDKKNGPGHDAYIGKVYYDPATKMYHKDIPAGYRQTNEGPFSIEGGYINQFNIEKSTMTPPIESPSLPTINLSSVTLDTKDLTPTVKVNATIPAPKKVSQVNPRPKTPYKERQSLELDEIFPDLLGTARLFATLRSNQRVRDYIRASLNPVIIDTYEKYSPVTGAFSEMLFRNRMGAEVQNQTARPFTSDASLQLAGQLQANSLARQEKEKGFLADDVEIKRTQGEALARQEDNLARRNQVANYNRQSINASEREKAMLEADHEKMNHISIDNYLRGLEQRLRYKALQKIEGRKAINALAENMETDMIYGGVLSKLQQEIDAWKRANPNKYFDTSELYNQIQGRMSKLNTWRNARYLSAAARANGYSYNNPILTANPMSFKNGGDITPSPSNIMVIARKLM